MKTKVKVDIELVMIQCGQCGVRFGLDSYHKERLLESGGDFYCPNGHVRIFTYRKDMEDRLNELQAELQEVETDKKYLTNKLRQTKNDLESTKRSRAAIKGQLTKTKNRIHKGVCPVCNRHFTNLHRHMEGQHPNYLDSTDDHD
jgi:hypothetical protein